MNWFIGISKRNGEIVAVTLSSTFSEFAGWQVSNLMTTWIHKAAILGKYPNHKNKVAVRAGMAQLEAEITPKIGFTPKAVWDHAITLFEQYKNQTEAPFEVVPSREIKRAEWNLL